LIEEAVGAVLSTVTVVPVVKVVGERAFPAVSRMVLLESRSEERRVGKEGRELTLTVRVETEPVTFVIEAPDTPVVVSAKSPVMTGVTETAYVIVWWMELRLVGFRSVIEEAVGAVLSTVTVVPVVKVVGERAFPAVSRMVLLES